MGFSLYNIFKVSVRAERCLDPSSSGVLALCSHVSISNSIFCVKQYKYRTHNTKVWIAVNEFDHDIESSSILVEIRVGRSPVGAGVRKSDENPNCRSPPRRPVLEGPGHYLQRNNDRVRTDIRRRIIPKAAKQQQHKGEKETRQSKQQHGTRALADGKCLSFRGWVKYPRLCYFFRGRLVYYREDTETTMVLSDGHSFDFSGRSRGSSSSLKN